MSTFPALIPSTRPVSGGQWSTADHVAMSGAITTVLLDATERGRRWAPLFEGVDQATWQTLRDHWEEHGTFEGFVFDAITLPAAWTPAGYWWRWAAPPQASDPYRGIRGVACEFELVPIVRRSYGGERLTAWAQIEPGDQGPGPTPPTSMVFGGELLAAAADLETTSTRQLPGQALARFTAAAGETAEGIMILPGGTVAVRGVQFPVGGWLRLYSSRAAREADAARPQTQKPLQGSGVISDPAWSTAAWLRPDVPDRGFNRETPASNEYPFRFTNQESSGTFTLRIEFSTIPGEAAWL